MPTLRAPKKVSRPLSPMEAAIVDYLPGASGIKSTTGAPTTGLERALDVADFFPGGGALVGAVLGPAGKKLLDSINKLAPVVKDIFYRYKDGLMWKGSVREVLPAKEAAKVFQLGDKVDDLPYNDYVEFYRQIAEFNKTSGKFAPDIPGTLKIGAQPTSGSVEGALKGGEPQLPGGGARLGGDIVGSAPAHQAGMGELDRLMADMQTPARGIKPLPKAKPVPGWTKEKVMEYVNSGRMYDIPRDIYYKFGAPRPTRK